MNLIEKFIETTKTNKDKIAIKQKSNVKTYHDLYIDVFKVVNYLEKMKVSKQSRILLFINMSYEMYVCLVGAIIYGLDVVIIDNFKDKNRVNNQILDAKVEYIFTNNVTSIVKNLFKPLRKIKLFNVSKIIKSKRIPIENIDTLKNKSGLITFTSGGTGRPKAVRRTLDDLSKQMDLTLQTLNVDTDEYVLATLPIYVLACLIQGLSVYVLDKKENIEDILIRESPSLMFSSISKYLEINKPINSIKKAFFGGSILYYNEAKKIKENIPNAEITYIYGATEASIISKTTLDEYIINLENKNLCMGNILPNNKVIIDNNEIVIVKGIITNNYLTEEKCEFHKTKDLGYVEENKIFITGRKITDNIFSDYLLEMLVKKEFTDIFNIAIIKIDEEYHIYLEEKDIDKRINIILILEKYLKNGIIHIVKRLPLDYRHNSKVDYKKLLTIVKE